MRFLQQFSEVIIVAMFDRDQKHRYFAIKYQQKMSYSRQVTRNKDDFNNCNSLSIQPYNPQPQPTRYEKSSPSPDHNTATAKRRLQKSPTFSINKNNARMEIQLFEESANGGKWEGMKGRVVYRNHTPKNSYYLLSSMKQLYQQSEKQLPNLSRNYSREELQFNSKFQSGNAAAVVRISREEYCIFTREDTNTHGLRQWYYFEVKSNRAIKVRLRIYSFSKPYSLYRHGMKPYIKINGEWIQAGQDISYCRDSQLNCFYLAFSLTFDEGQRLQIANMPPYTYSNLLRFLGSFQQTEKISVQSIGCSLGGVNIPSIQMVQKGREERRAIIILARTHPGETCSNFSLERIIKGLCESEFLRNAYDFYIVPMVNPDGVIVGNHRTSLAGSDLNRRFASTLVYHDLFPQVEAVKKLVKSVEHSHRIEFLFDLHGHSAQADVFAYAGFQTAGSDHFLKSRIIPKLLSEAWRGFSYNSCVFQQAREKNTTARVYFRNRTNITSITIEQSYGLLGNSLISVADWRRFGDSFIMALSEYTSRYLNNPQNLAHVLQKETQQQLIEEALKLKNAKEKEEKSALIEEKLSGINLGEIRQSNNSPIFPSAEDIQSLDSGDENLEITDSQLNFIQQNMNIQVRQSNPRQLYELNDKTIKYEEIDVPRGYPQHTALHDKLPLVSRILRTKMRKGSSNLIDILTSRKKESSEQRARSINASLKLPFLPQKI